MSPKINLPCTSDMPFRQVSQEHFVQTPCTTTMSTLASTSEESKILTAIDFLNRMEMVITSLEAPYIPLMISTVCQASLSSYKPTIYNRQPNKESEAIIIVQISSRLQINRESNIKKIR